MRRDLGQFTFVYVIVFVLVVATKPDPLDLKMKLFVGCFIFMAGLYCGLAAIWRAVRPTLDAR